MLPHPQDLAAPSSHRGSSSHGRFTLELRQVAVDGFGLEQAARQDEPVVLHLRDVRDRLYRIFAADTVGARVTALHTLLRTQAAQAQIIPDTEGDSVGIVLAKTGRRRTGKITKPDPHPRHAADSRSKVALACREVWSATLMSITEETFRYVHFTSLG